MRRAALLTVVVLAGCGGGGDKGGDRAAYEKEGNAACDAYATAIAKLGQPDEVSEIGPFIVKALPVLKSSVGRVAKLDPPSDLRDAYETFRDASTKTVARAEALGKAAEAADAEEVQRLLAEAAEASKRRVDLARAAGLEACAEI